MRAEPAGKVTIIMLNTVICEAENVATAVMLVNASKIGHGSGTVITHSELMIVAQQWTATHPPTEEKYLEASTRLPCKTPS